MAKDNSLGALRKLSKPQTFSKGDIICREGMPGMQMYIVIQGSVGVYIDTLLDEHIKIADVRSGDFFGEMSLFDQLPRSATCVAMEDTVCVAINRKNLREFIINCPDITENLLFSMSARVRSMNDQIYKSSASIAPDRFPPFIIPPLHGPHEVETPPADPKSLVAFDDKCPICETEIKLNHIQTYTLSLVRMEENMRRIYKEVNVLWHYLWSCPECGYTNFSTNFHQIKEKQRQVVAHIVSDQLRYKSIFASGCQFDDLLFQYYQTIHLNECINGNASLLLGKLWLYLHWLYTDVKDGDMTVYTRERAIAEYEKAFNGGSRTLRTPDAQQQCAQVLAELYLEKEDFETAWQFYQEVTKCGSKFLIRKAHDRIYQIREMRKLKQAAAN